MLSPYFILNMKSIAIIIVYPEYNETFCNTNIYYFIVNYEAIVLLIFSKSILYALCKLLDFLHNGGLKMDCFKLLGIEPTIDKNIIKHAYAKLIPLHSFETDPEGFSNIKFAYEAALKESSKTEEKALNFSSINQFMEEFEKNYGDFKFRIDSAEWVSFLDRDICYSIDTSEEIGNKILTFIMDNPNFPNKILAIFDSFFFWSSSDNRLHKDFPRSFINTLIDKIHTKDSFDYDYLLNSRDCMQDEFILQFEAAKTFLNDNNLYKAKKSIDKANDICPSHPDLFLLKCEYLIKIGNNNEAAKLLEQIKKEPLDKATIFFLSGEISFKTGDIVAAYNNYKKALALDQTHTKVLYSLGLCSIGLKKYEEALNCFKKLNALMPNNKNVINLLQASYDFQKDSQK